MAPNTPARRNSELLYTRLALDIYRETKSLHSATACSYYDDRRDEETEGFSGTYTAQHSVRDR